MTSGVAGAFVCVMGPSGAGKDTLIAGARHALAGDPSFLFVRRLVTRQASAFEDHASLTEEAFAAGVAADAFALSWRAHGLGYAVPREARAAVDKGIIAVCNLSRAAVAAARDRFPRIVTVLVTAPDRVLAQRLAGRGRETDDAVRARLDRGLAAHDDISPDHVIVNDGSPEEGTRKLLAVLLNLRPSPAIPLR